MNTCRFCAGPADTFVCVACWEDLYAEDEPADWSLLVQPLHDRERDEHLRMPYFPTAETTSGEW